MTSYQAEEKTPWVLTWAEPAGVPGVPWYTQNFVEKSGINSVD
jgi:hypothetical protein